MISVSKKGVVSAAAVSVLSWASTVSADGFFSDLWEKTSINAAIRTDFAAKTTDLQDPYNQFGMPFQNVEVPRQAYVPPTLSTNVLSNLVPALKPITGPATAGLNWGIPIPGYSDSIKRSTYIGDHSQEFNYLTERFSTEINTKFSDNLQFIGRVRAIYSPTSVYGGFDANTVSQYQGGIASGGGYRGADTGRPSYYGSRAKNGKDINPLEFAGSNYEVDFPTALLDYKKDNYDIRLGNQSIAWGQAIFLQTFDVPNGLDLRRHLVLDRAIEEFEDKRVPSLALRGTLQVSDSTLVDAFVSKFQPTVLPNPNTPYNVIPSQFYKPLDDYYEHSYQWKPDAGIRFKSDFGSFGFSAFASSRMNPLGVFRWAESGINKGLYPTSTGAGAVLPLSTIVTTAYNLKSRNCAVYNPTTCRLYGSVGEALSHTPFTVGPAGVYSGQEYLNSAGSVRLDAVKTVNTAIADFPALRDVYASPVDNQQQAINLLDTFFIGSGGSLRGNVEREYVRENIVGLGGSVVTDSSIGALNEIILNFEGQYTPRRTFTDTGLGHNFYSTDEYIVSAVAEKWTRWTDAFPAAYLVFEYQHKSASDLVGLSLKGYGASDRNDPVSAPKGVSGADYVVFAGFQPTPNRKFVFEWAFLYDVRGGLLAQPEVQYNIGHGFIGEVFYNYTNGHLYGTPTDNLIRAIDADDEVAMRLTYQF